MSNVSKKNADKSAPVKRVSAKMKAAIDALVHGDVKTITDAAAKAGISREHLSRELRKPHMYTLLRDKTLGGLAIAAARAGAVKIELLDSDNAMVRDRASSFVLGLAGIQPDSTPNAPPSETRPGVSIVIVQAPAIIQQQPEPKLIEMDPNPLIVA